MEADYHNDERIQSFLRATKHELTVRGYSPKTIKNYLLCVKKYFSFVEEHCGSFEKADEGLVKEFLLEMVYMVLLFGLQEVI